MTPELQAYAKRFDLDLNQQAFSTFFTQLDLGSFVDKLPYLFDIDNFCVRLLEALLLEQKICIYSDFDTDATTATGVMYWGLLDLGYTKDNLFFYVPDRFTEGYGLNPEAISQLADNFDLIITVDCGINSTIEAHICKDKRADLIITDHHHLASNLPDCVAVCNPRLADFYQSNPSLIKKPIITNDLKIKLTQNQLRLIEDSLKKIHLRQTQILNSAPNNNTLNPSVTGVGTAWFCLVWLGYMLDNLEIN